MFILAIYILEFAKISRYTGARKGRTYTDTSSQCTSQRERAHVLLAHYSATRVIYFRPFSLSLPLSLGCTFVELVWRLSRVYEADGVPLLSYARRQALDMLFVRARACMYICAPSKRSYLFPRYILGVRPCRAVLLRCERGRAAHVSKFCEVYHTGLFMRAVCLCTARKELWERGFVGYRVVEEVDQGLS